MSTQIGIISDIHAQPESLTGALNLFTSRQVNYIFCAGDISGYGEQLEETVSLLQKHNCLCVKGNHEAWRKNQPNVPAYINQYLETLPGHICVSISGINIYMVHANPPDSCSGGIRLLDKAGQVDQGQYALWTNKLEDFEHEVLIVGHTHQVFAEKLANTLVINPGSTAYNHSCAILELPSMKTEFFALSGKDIKTTWNWSEEFKK